MIRPANNIKPALILSSDFITIPDGQMGGWRNQLRPALSLTGQSLAILNSSIDHLFIYKICRVSIYPYIKKYPF